MGNVLVLVLIEIGVDGGDGGVLDVGRGGEVGEALGEVDGAASLGEMGEFLDWGWG